MDPAAPTSPEPPELVDLVDADDRVVGRKPRHELLDGVDRWRMVAVLVCDPAQRRVLLARRAAHKVHDPGRWSPCVSGTVSAGDGYHDTVLREAHEEIGLRPDPAELEVVHHGRWDSPGALRNAAIYLWHKDLDVASLRWDRGEADALEWFELHELLDACTHEPHRFGAGVPRLVALLTDRHRT